MKRASSDVALAVQLKTIWTLGSVGSLTDDELVERFLARSDMAESEAAFAALVERHGAMVLSVCKRIMQHDHDAHDAFQATFLVLARKAGSIPGRGATAAWLFGVARRGAVKARAGATRRRRQLEKLHAQRLAQGECAATMNAPEPEPDYGPLLAAIDTLPDRLRTPVILHYFEGIATEAIAARVGCRRGTVLSRLARARTRLRRRLEHRGYSLDVLMPAASAEGRMFSSATVPAQLVESTVRAASSLALAGTMIESLIPATALYLSRAVVRNLAFARVRPAAVVVLLGIASVAIGLSMAGPVAEKGAPAGLNAKGALEQAGGRQAADLPKPSESKKGDSVTIRGQVLDRDGKPVAGAQIVAALPRLTVQSDWSSPRSLGISRAEGRFEVALPREALARRGPSGVDRPVIAAVAAGHAPDWVKLDLEDAGDPPSLTLRLRRDDVPVEGRVTGPDGKPVSGLTVYTVLLANFPAKSLDKLKQNAGSPNDGLFEQLFTGALILAKDGFISSVRTDIDGRFRLPGVGRDRVALVLIEGESVAQSQAMIYTSSDPAYVPLALPADDFGDRLFGPRCELTVAPGRVIDGVIHESNSARPVGGVMVRSAGFMLSATSDARGHFRIPSQPKQSRADLEVVTEGQPYIQVGKTISEAPGLGPIHVDVALKRGVWVEGKVQNQADGRPVSAIVQYYPLRDNPHLKDCPDASFFDKNLSDDGEFPTDADGKFRVVALPGEGILAVRTIDRKFVVAKPLSDELAGKVLYNDGFENAMKQFQALVTINPGDVEQERVPDIMVVQGRTQHVQVLRADGTAAAGVLMIGLLPPDGRGDLSSRGEFTFVHPEPGNDESVVIAQEDGVAGAALIVNGHEADPIRVTLQATSTVTGRLIDEQGKARPNIPIVVNHAFGTISRHRFGVQPPTGPDGRFRIGGLVPGVAYSIDAIEIDKTTHQNRFLGWIGKPEQKFKSGETQDWGDVCAKKSYQLRADGGD